MTPEEYRSALADLGLSQNGGAKALAIHERTSRRYAQHGLSPLAAIRVRAQLETLRARKRTQEEGSE